MFDVQAPSTADASESGTQALLLLLLTVPVLLLFVFVSFTAAWLFAIAGIAIALAVFYIRNRRKWQGADSWPVEQATVEFANVREVFKRHVHYFLGELAYSYCVEGEYFSGFCVCRFPTEKGARDFAETFRGKTIPVRYNPEDPAISLMSAAELSAANDD